MCDAAVACSLLAALAPGLYLPQLLQAAQTTTTTQPITMQLSNRTQCSSCSSSRPSSRPRLPLRVTATAIPNNGYVPPSPSSLDRPAGGGSRSYDLPPASDLVAWAPRSDYSRPSNGANRGPSFATASSSSDATGSIDRPGGRGGRGDMPSSNDTPVSGDPALSRPGGRAGRDLGLGGGSSTPAPQDPANSRPGGRGGRDNVLGSMDTPVAPISLDRPGGRAGRDAPGGGGNDGGNDGGSGGGGDDSSSSSGDEGGFNFGKAVGSVALYGGVIAAAWAAHKAFFAKEQPAAEKKSCCGCSKGKGEKAEPAGKGKKK